MTEHAVRQQGTALQKGAATEDRQEKKTAQAAASAKNREDGVPQQELERFARFRCPRSRRFTSRKRDNGCLRSGRKNAGKRNARRQKKRCFMATLLLSENRW